jgi:alkyldihydroxyacetonephosphate synthase
MTTTAAGRRPVNLEFLGRLRDVVGARRVSRSGMEGVAYSRDLWPRDLLAIRRGEVEHRPDFVVWPETTDEVSRILRLCNDARVPVVPFGAGSGLCGGATPTSGGVVLDLKRMNRLERLSEKSQIAVCQPGIIGAHLEHELNRHGYTLGHFPGSLGTSTLGGYLATRSAGMAASYYGKIEDMVVSMQVVLADGTVLATRTAPRRATGPDFNHLFLGSEGTLGVITRAHLRVRLVPEDRVYRAFAFKQVAGGLTSLRLLLRAGLKPSFARLSDPADAAANLKPLGINAAGCVLALLFDGRKGQVELAARKAAEICREHGARDHGEEPARLWYEHRFSEFYRQSPLLTDSTAFFGVVEAAATWRNIETVYAAVRQAVSGSIEVRTQFPHFYPEGASVQFTLVGKATRANEQNAYRNAWRKLPPAILQAGGVISHHHGIGLEKSEWLPQQQGAAYGVWRGIKERLDPNHILNPGKVFAAAEGSC